MKLETTVENLLKVLKDGLKPAKNSAIPILLYVKISAESITATDLDLTTIIELGAEGEGEFLIPYHNVVGVLTGEKGRVTLESVPGEPYDVPAPNTPGHSTGVCGCEKKWEAGPTGVYGNVYSCGHVDKDKPEEYENPDAKVTRNGPSTIRVSVNGCVYTFNGMPLERYPVTPEFDGDTAYIGREAFNTLLERTAFAISKEESRYTLNGALLIVNGNGARMVATDGHRLSLADAPDAEGRLTTLVPADAVRYLLSRAGDASVTVTSGKANADSTAESIRFVMGNKQLICRKLAGQFPNYEAVMPRGFKLQMYIPSPSAIGKTLARVAKCADERSGCVRWTFDPIGGPTLNATSTETGTAKAALPLTVQPVVTETAGESESGELESVLSIGLSSPYVAEFLKVAGDEPVTLNLRDSQSAAMFTAQNWNYVVMPMRM